MKNLLNQMQSKTFLGITLATVMMTFAPVAAHAASYYIAPDYNLNGTKASGGSDSNNGNSTSSPIKTFNKAWQLLMPGDTLYMMDGIYYQQMMPNVRSGQSGKPITVKALNDGQAIIDGDLNRNGVQDLEPTDVIPVQIGWTPVAREWFVLEGFVARNSGLSANETVSKNNGHVIRLWNASNNTLRRISAYNANADSNSAVIGLIDMNVKTDGSNLSTYNNLIEDCVAAGTGRKMAFVWRGQNNTFRRCFAMWTRWDGKYWFDAWPNGSNLEIYAGKNNIIENGIAYGRAPNSVIVSGRVGYGGTNNSVLGTVSINSGTNENGTEWDWTNEARPSSPVGHTAKVDVNWPGQRNGFWNWKENVNETWSNNTFQDVLSTKSAGLGFYFGVREGSYNINSKLYNATIVANGAGILPAHNDIPNTTLMGYDKNKPNIDPTSMTGFDIKNSKIDGTNFNGEGARLGCRYVNGKQTTESLWPWPMAGRIKAEFPREIKEANYKNVTVENNVYSVLQNLGATKCFASTGGTQGTPSPTPTPTVTATPKPTTSPTVSVTPTPVASTVAGVSQIPSVIDALAFYASSGRFDKTLVAGSTTNYKVNNIYPPVLLSYKVNSTENADYDVYVYTASGDTDANRSSRNVSIRVAGKEVLPGVVVPVTGGWDNFKEVKIGKLTLPKGQSDITVVLGNYIDYDAVSFKKVSPAASEFKVEAESFASTSAGSSASKYVISSTTDTGGGSKVGGIYPPLTFNYNINVAGAGSYDVYVRTSSQDTNATRNRTFTLTIDGKTVGTLVKVPVTGDWNIFNNVYAGRVTNLTQGAHTMALTSETGWYDTNYVLFKPATAGTPTPTPVSTVTPTVSPSATPTPTPTRAPVITKLTLPNPGFESALGDTFVNTGPAQFYRDSGDKSAGSYSFKISSSATGAEAVSKTVYKTFALNASAAKDYTLKLRAKTVNVSDKVTANIIFADANGNVLSSNKVNVTVNPNSMSWADFSGTATAPASTAKMRVELTVNGSGEAWFDDLQIDEITK